MGRRQFDKVMDVPPIDRPRLHSAKNRSGSLAKSGAPEEVPSL
jgi:hypothetical protein